MLCTARETEDRERDTRERALSAVAFKFIFDVAQRLVGQAHATHNNYWYGLYVVVLIPQRLSTHTLACELGIVTAHAVGFLKRNVNCFCDSPWSQLICACVHLPEV